MKLSELLAASEIIEWHADQDIDVTNITADSRKAKEGTLFIAVPGHQVDGHDFIPQVAQAGAAVAITERPVDGIPYVVVKDSYREQGRIADCFYDHPSRKMTMIGITGTNGKTTCTYLVKSLIEKLFGYPVGLIGTNQNMIGEKCLETHNTTPDGITLQGLLYNMVQEGCKACVMEVSSHSLQEERVAEVDYDLGAFTNLTQDHLDFHKTMENYLNAKAKLFKMCKKAALNADDAASEKIAAQATAELMTFGEHENADLYAKNISLAADHVSFTAVTKEEEAEITLGIPGKFSVYNALTALSIGHMMGCSLEKMAAVLATVHGIKGRVEVVPTPLSATVLIDYAHSPDALENVLTSLRGVMSKGKIYTLFGCGGDRDRTKRPKMGKIVGDLTDIAIVTSDNPRTEDPVAIIAEILPGIEGTQAEVKVIPDRREAIRWGLSQLQDGDLLLLAGKGHETYQEINHVRYHLDEREEIAAYFDSVK